MKLRIVIFFIFEEYLKIKHITIKIDCFQHVPFEDLGHIKTWIQNEGHQLHYTRFFEQYTIPEPEDYDWLIVMR